MTAVRYDDVVPASMGPAPEQARKPPQQQPSVSSGNPLMDMTTRLLSIPLHQIYAALWRAGIIEVRA